MCNKVLENVQSHPFLNFHHLWFKEEAVCKNLFVSQGNTSTSFGSYIYQHAHEQVNLNNLISPLRACKQKHSNLPDLADKQISGFVWTWRLVWSYHSLIVPVFYTRRLGEAWSIWWCNDDKINLLPFLPWFVDIVADTSSLHNQVNQAFPIFLVCSEKHGYEVSLITGYSI